MKIERPRCMFFQNKGRSLTLYLVCTRRLSSSILLVNDSREVRRIKHTRSFSPYFSFTFPSAPKSGISVFQRDEQLPRGAHLYFAFYAVIMAELKFKLAYRSG